LLGFSESNSHNYGFAYDESDTGYLSGSTSCTQLQNEHSTTINPQQTIATFLSFPDSITNDQAQNNSEDIDLSVRQEEGCPPPIHPGSESPIELSTHGSEYDELAELSTSSVTSVPPVDTLSDMVICDFSGCPRVFENRKKLSEHRRYHLKAFICEENQCLLQKPQFSTR